MAYSNMQTGNSHLITVLRDGRTAGLCYNVGGQINVEAGKGHEWSFPLYSGDTFKYVTISMSTVNPVRSTSFSGLVGSRVQPTLLSFRLGEQPIRQYEVFC